MPGEMVHFDIPVNDVDKAIDFYGYVMGWEFDRYGDGGGDEAMEYWLLRTDRKSA